MKVKTAHLPDCSWKWPAASHGAYSFPDNLEYDGSMSDYSSDSPEEGSLFKETPEPAHEYKSHSTDYSTTSTPLGCVAHAFCASVEGNMHKRMCDLSPISPDWDGLESNKKQLILWQPSLSRLLKLQNMLACSEVELYSKAPYNPTIPTPIDDTMLHAHDCQELNLGGVALSKDQWKDWGLG